ncbi:protein YgiW [Escherichia coli H605]|uniref:Protein YgiW n=5 Tax=root TaxID=1 RepID=A0AAJ3NXT2_ECOLX|nr:protein YgiW [Escherichia coli H605]
MLCTVLNFLFFLKKLLRSILFNARKQTLKGVTNMKKLAAVIAVMALCSAPVMAAEQGGFSGPSATQSQTGGFQGPNGSVTNVENAKSLRDDTWVTLRGNIVERISDDLYVFKDASGTINVDIDHKRWNGVTVTPKDTVEIQGEVDKDWNSVEIDVKQIRKVNP